MNWIQNEKDSVDRIRNHFGFLFDRDFEVAFKRFDEDAMGNWVVVLQSKECIIRFIQDRGEIRIEIGPPWASTEWSPKKHFVYPKTLLEYIKNDQSVSPPSINEISLDPDDQLQELKIFLASHYDKLVSFLNRADFAEQEEKIETFALDKFKKNNPNIKFQT